MTDVPEGSHAVESEALELVVDGHVVAAWHARPEGMPIGGLVLIPDISGLRPLFEEHAHRLATNGLAVVVVEPFAFVPAAERGADVEARMPQVATFDDELMLATFETAADWLVVHDDVSSVAVLGFCMGGMYALKAASTGRFDRAISVYGMPRLPAQWKGPGQHDPVAMIEGAAEPTPVLAFFGTADTLIPMSTVDDLRGALVRVPASEVVVYEGGEHGFVHDPSRPTHRADDALDVWRRILAALGVTRAPRV